MNKGAPPLRVGDRVILTSWWNESSFLQDYIKEKKVAEIIRIKKKSDGHSQDIVTIKFADGETLHPALRRLKRVDYKTNKEALLLLRKEED